MQAAGVRRAVDSADFVRPSAARSAVPENCLPLQRGASSCFLSHPGPRSRLRPAAALRARRHDLGRPRCAPPTSPIVWRR
eukprot:scaffold2677_cov220-Pinguiococcus_pyrenoidosus.AAC.12